MFGVVESVKIEMVKNVTYNRRKIFRKRKMASFCVVFKCKNRRQENKKNVEQIEMKRVLNRKISFHLFPKDMEMRKKWLEALYLQNYEPKKSAAVCSVHFKEMDYQLDKKLCTLKKDAVPHLRETEIQPEYTIKTNVDKPTTQANLDKPPILKNLHELSIKTNSDVSLIQIESNNAARQTDLDNPPLQTVSSDLDHQNTSTKKITDTDNGNKVVHRSTSISPERIMNSPTKTRIREVYKDEIKHLKRKLSISNYEHKRTRQKFATLKNVLKDLQKRNLLAADDSNILQHLDKGTKELIKRDIRMLIDIN